MKTPFSPSTLSLSLSLPANNPEHPRIVPAHGSALQPPGTGFDQCFPFTNISDFPGLSILPPPIYTGRRLDRAPKAVQVPPTRISGTCLIGFSSPLKGILQSIRSLAALLRHGRARAPRPLPDPDPGPPGGRRPGGQGAGRDRSDNFTKTKSPSPDCSSSSHPPREHPSSSVSFLLHFVTSSTSHLLFRMFPWCDEPECYVSFFSDTSLPTRVFPQKNLLSPPLKESPPLLLCPLQLLRHLPLSFP